MITKFDIGDDIVFTLTGKVLRYCVDKDCDYFTIKVTNKVDDQKEGTWLYLSTNDLNAMLAEHLILGEEAPVVPVISLAEYRKAHEAEDKDE